MWAAKFHIVFLSACAILQLAPAYLLRSTRRATLGTRPAPSAQEKHGAHVAVRETGLTERIHPPTLLHRVVQDAQPESIAVGTSDGNASQTVSGAAPPETVAEATLRAQAAGGEATTLGSVTFTTGVPTATIPAPAEPGHTTVTIPVGDDADMRNLPTTTATVPPGSPAPSPPSPGTPNPEDQMSKIIINFQDLETEPLNGTFADYGGKFRTHLNGYAYGWFCGPPATQGRHRGVENYSDIENTIVCPDRNSQCPDEHWTMALPNGSYQVEVVFQDPAHDTDTHGCRLQGMDMGLGTVIQGHAGSAIMTVDVVDGNLTLAASWSQGCQSINRITIVQVIHKIQINFQDANSPVPAGWLADYGTQYSEHGLLKYGWACGPPATEARNRETPNFTILENTLVTPDRGSTCAHESWEIELSKGAYNVLFTFQDTAHDINVSACEVEGYPVGGGMVPVGVASLRNVTLPVTDGKLTFKGSWAWGCESVNRVIIEPVITEVKINFQDRASIIPTGWSADYGEPFRTHSIGHRYGWKCGTPSTQTRHRRREGYNDMQNTIISPDRLGDCNDEQWDLEVINGIYSVEITIQDPGSRKTETEGCLVENTPLGMGDVGPDDAVTNTLTVRVLDGNLTLAGSWAFGCSSFNRIIVTPIVLHM